MHWMPFLIPNHVKALKAVCCYHLTKESVRLITLLFAAYISIDKIMQNVVLRVELINSCMECCGL